METIFNNLLDIKAVIGKETKDREDYVGTMLEGIRTEKNDAKKGVSLALQAKEGLEQLKVRSILETANIKSELSEVRKESERADHERFEMSKLKIQVDEMRAEMVKT